MTDEKKPDPVEDIRKGLGLLFRAAKTAVDEFPTEKLEDAVKQGVREVGRALETVTHVIEEQVSGKKPSTAPTEPAERSDSSASSAPPAGSPPADSAPAASAAPGPHVTGGADVLPKTEDEKP